MLGLHQTGTLYKRTGQQSAKPVYAATGTSFACRAEETRARSASSGDFSRNDALRRTDTVTIYTPSSLDIAPGDKVVIINMGTYFVSEIRLYRDGRGAHHMTITAASHNGGT